MASERHRRAGCYGDRSFHCVPPQSALSPEFCLATDPIDRAYPAALCFTVTLVTAALRRLMLGLRGECQPLPGQVEEIRLGLGIARSLGHQATFLGLEATSFRSAAIGAHAR
jgi:hypothetical protein